MVERAEYRADPSWAPLSAVDRMLAEARLGLRRVDARAGGSRSMTTVVC